MRRIFSKKSLAAVLSSVMLLSALAACGSKTEESGQSSSAEKEQSSAGKPEPSGESTIVIGTASEPSGDMGVPFWSNAQTEFEVLSLTEGYGLVYLTDDGEFKFNERILDSHKAQENPDHSKTYTFTLKGGESFSDGTPITAKHYLAAGLIFSHPTMKELKAKLSSSPFYPFVGFEEYSEGKSKEMKGVRLLDDKTFSVTISADQLPNFFELSKMSLIPFPYEFWTKDGKPGPVDFKDDGQGAYIVGDQFTPENYKETFEKARFGSQLPGSGPYSFEGFDKVNKTYTLLKNPKFTGGPEGEMPEINRIVLKGYNDATVMDELKAGTLDVVGTILEGDKITAGLKMTEEQPERFAKATYPRAGYGKIQFVCDFGPTASVKVRQAIAHLTNRPEFIKSFCSGYGSIVNGPYGEGEWKFKESKAELAKRLETYPYSYDKAVKLLEEDGWVYDEKGQPYQEGQGLRYKKDEKGELQPLVIKWASSEGNPVSELLNTLLKQSKEVAKAGMRIDQDVMKFAELLNYLYRDGSKDEKFAVPTYHMFNLASSIPAAYTPELNYAEAEVKDGVNLNRLVDKDLERVANSFFKVDSSKREEFRKGWVEFVTRWNEVLPDVPLYSNLVHVFYNAKLDNFEPTAYRSDIQSIAYAKLKK